MDNQRIKLLLDKYRKKSLSPEETKELDEWYYSFDHKPDDKHLRNLPKDELKARIYSRIIKHTQIQKKRHLKKQMSWAAVVALVLISSITCYNLQNKTVRKQTAEAPEVPRVTLEVPEGQVIRRVLPDGSKVWLNAGSKISYNKEFEGDGRQVSLEGEGFFEVIHNEKKPFIVHCGELQTRVLGTSFTVKSLPGLKIFEVTVRTGKVQVKDTTQLLASLLPLQRLSIDENGDPVVSTVENDRFMSWTKGELYLDNQTFSEIAWRLGKKFGAKVTIHDPQLEKLRFSGDLTGLSVHQSLDVLREIHPFNVQDKDSVIEITRSR